MRGLVMKHRGVRIALLAAMHVLACAWLLWYLMPRPEGHEKVIEGLPVWNVFGTRSKDSSVLVNGLSFGCHATSVGAKYSCPKQFDDGTVARVTYFEMTTLDSALNIADRPLVLLKIEQAGHLKYSKSYDDLRERYFIGGTLIPLCLFGISFIWLKNKFITKEKVKTKTIQIPKKTAGKG